MKICPLIDRPCIKKKCINYKLHFPRYSSRYHQPILVYTASDSKTDKMKDPWGWEEKGWWIFKKKIHNGKMITRYRVMSYYVVDGYDVSVEHYKCIHFDIDFGTIQFLTKRVGLTEAWIDFKNDSDHFSHPRMKWKMVNIHTFNRDVKSGDYIIV
jgi:hypothetical protein